ncbi:MAG TPA: mannose-1-phosphate guanylyltransferase/mannose-6-phosphate isomerase [Aliidongia sp.]|nr:mannose-1-phosphate guanylyltransferase/mannose-6-phosphate isomerase [Aliidongia sp.]
MAERQKSISSVSAGADGSRIIYPVILSGGSGTRLWPMSRSAYPKQLLPLLSELSLLQETVRRVAGRPMLSAPLILANDEHRFIIAEQLRQIEVKPRTIMLEPIARNTAPAAAAAAIYLASIDPDALMLIMPSDHIVADTEAFRHALEIGRQAAAGGKLVTFGITPERPETGYGYIRQGAGLAIDGAFDVAAFVEKPDLAHAESYIASGDYTWNSGIFLFPVKTYLEELEARHPEMVTAARDAVAKAKADLDFLRLDGDAFGAAPSESIDYAVMEHTKNAAVVPVSMGWNDVGAWDALWEVSPKKTEEHGNVEIGDVVAVDCRGSYFRVEEGLLAAFGVEDMIVVATADAVLVAPKNRAQDVKQLIDKLKADKRSELTHLSTVHRPWGTYRTIHMGDRVQVKHIVVKPGAKLSLQKHHHRAEHWVVVRGTALVVRGDEEIMLSENQSTYIPLGTQHRLVNPGRIPLHLIEVQSGSYLGEDDIVRIEDTYGRL